MTTRQSARHKMYKWCAGNCTLQMSLISSRGTISTLRPAILHDPPSKAPKLASATSVSRLWVKDLSCCLAHITLFPNSKLTRKFLQLANCNKLHLAKLSCLPTTLHCMVNNVRQCAGTKNFFSRRNDSFSYEQMGPCTSTIPQKICMLFSCLQQRTESTLSIKCSSNEPKNVGAKT